MLYLNIALGALFFSLGFWVTENNAQYILSGYNTMSAEEQAKFSLKEFLRRFKLFHMYFGVVFTAVGVVLFSFAKELFGYHLGITPIAAYLYFFWTTRDLQMTNSKKQRKNFVLGMVVLGITLLLTLGLLLWSDKENVLTYDDSAINISGPYGLQIDRSDITAVEILQELPEINKRKHGISTNTAAKGIYLGPHNTTYRLLIDKPAAQYLRIDSKGSDPVIISLSTVDERAVFEALR